MQVKDWILGIAIAILTIFVVVYGFNTFFPKVDYDDFCDGLRYKPIIHSPENCESLGGTWINDSRDCVGAVPQCEKDYRKAEESRAKKIFFIGIPLGVLFVIIGGFLFGIEAIGAGLMGGGILTILYSAGVYWQYGGNLFKFILSLLGLSAVIYIAYWFNKKSKK